VCNKTENFLCSGFAAFKYTRKAHHEPHAIARLSFHRPLYQRVFFVVDIEKDRFISTAKSEKAFTVWLNLEPYDASTNSHTLSDFGERV
jgi:hypothetical protein